MEHLRALDNFLGKLGVGVIVGVGGTTTESADGDSAVSVVTGVLVAFVRVGSRSAFRAEGF